MAGAKPIRRLPGTVLSRGPKLLVVAVACVIVAAVLQVAIRPKADEFHAGEKNLTLAGSGLNNEFLLLPLLGFREAAAGLLWVRCDEFFHSGDYDAILPLVRIITWLDPHAENVYVTGAWHLAYNFTDSSERSDRRYIPPAQALLDEGIANNPSIPDIKFEKAWQHYDKIKNYPEAARMFKSSIDGPRGDGTGAPGSDDYPYAAPLKNWHLLAHAYEKIGRIPLALDAWQHALTRSAAMIKDRPDDSGTKQLRAAEIHNSDELMQRWHDRYTTTDHTKINPSPYPAIVRPTATDPKPHPWDVSFEPTVEVTRPKVFRISGFFNSADGSRIDVRFSDWNFKERAVTGVLSNFDIDLTQTILIDSIAVRKDHFDREVDMSQDPKMYGFNQDYYKLTLSYNPRSTAPHLQDRFGWSGEGLTDHDASHVAYDSSPASMGTRLYDSEGGTGPIWDGKTIPWDQFGQPIRMIRVTYRISRDQVMGRSPITAANIVPGP